MKRRRDSSAGGGCLRHRSETFADEAGRLETLVGGCVRLETRIGDTSMSVKPGAAPSRRLPPLVAAAIGGLVLSTSPGGAAEGGPKGRSYVVMMTQTQISSGLARHLVPPMVDALDRAGMTNAKGPGAEWVVSVESSADHGAWLGSGESRRWRHVRTVSVTFAPNEGFPRKAETSTFTVDARVVTADPDRTDEFRCLVDLAVKTAMTRWKKSGRVAVQGVACEHGE
jgi:hypothetical protein